MNSLKETLTAPTISILTAVGISVFSVTLALMLNLELRDVLTPISVVGFFYVATKHIVPWMMNNWK